MTTAELLRADGLYTGYGQIPVIRDVNITVAAGEVVCLLGANGAGKTSTVLALAGELPVNRGQVMCLGSTSGAPLYRRARQGLALVPEERGVIPGLTVRDNLRLGRGPVGRALDLFPELKPLLPRRAGLLSGGEQQILSLARALAADPRLILADEMSLGLAPLVVQRLLEALREATNRGAGVLLVEQQVRAALAIADRAYILQRGQIVRVGPAAELLADIDQIEAMYMTATAATTERETA